MTTKSMWDKIFTPEFTKFARTVTEDTENFATIGMFSGHMRQRVNYQEIVVLAMRWKAYDDTRQANLAVHFAGIYHASRFIILMDYLSEKLIKGELK